MADEIIHRERVIEHDRDNTGNGIAIGLLIAIFIVALFYFFIWPQVRPVQAPPPQSGLINVQGNGQPQGGSSGGGQNY